MNREDIIRMAREAQQESFVGDTGHWFKMEAKDLERFAQLVAAAEREACANVVEKIETYEKIEKACFKFAAKTIQARGEK